MSRMNTLDEIVQAVDQELMSTIEQTITVVSYDNRNRDSCVPDHRKIAAHSMRITTEIARR